MNASAPSQILGAGILRENERWLGRARRLAARDDVSRVAPDGGLNSFVRPARVPDTAAFSAHLRDEHGVAAPPGEMFGAKGWLRLSVSAPVDVLREALRRTGA